MLVLVEVAVEVVEGEMVEVVSQMLVVKFGGEDSQ